MEIAWRAAPAALPKVPWPPAASDTAEVRGSAPRRPPLSVWRQRHRAPTPPISARLRPGAQPGRCQHRPGRSPRAQEAVGQAGNARNTSRADLLRRCHLCKRSLAMPPVPPPVKEVEPIDLVENPGWPRSDCTWMSSPGHHIQIIVATTATHQNYTCLQGWSPRTSV